MTDKTDEGALDVGVDVTYRHARKRTSVRSFSFHGGDDELVDFIAESLGTSRSEGVRSAVRAFAAHLAFLQGSRQK